MSNVAEAPSRSSVAATAAPVRSPASPGLAIEPRASQSEIVERALIDASTRVPVLFLFGTAVAWLLIATLLGFIASIKLHAPDFLDTIPFTKIHLPFLTYGRIVPAYNNAFQYGWCSLAGMGVAIWLMARLCRVSLRAPGALVFGVILWNIGLGVGILSILLGQGRSLELLELPVYSHAIMFVGFGLVGLWGAVLYRYRRGSGMFISVWYLLGALFWFPWLLSTANVLLALPHVHGVMQSVVGAWYAQNLQGWWFTSIGLAAAYFLIPKVIDRPVHSYNLATLGFWSFAIFSGLTGMVRLSGGPIPAWVVTLSIAASIMMLVPLATVTVNLLTTMRGRFNMVYHSPTLRFVFFGALAFTVTGALSILVSLRSVDSVLHFTQFVAAHQHLLLYSFYSMVMFGAIYYITPRLVGCEWLSSTMISLHFWGSAYGGGFLAALLICAGIAQGSVLSEPDSTFAQVIQLTGGYFPGQSFIWFLVAVGHGIFALHFLLMLLRIGQPGGTPTLFAPIEEEASAH
jgi:cytochrome c oxidase cbb3-type subunit 1